VGLGGADRRAGSRPFRHSGRNPTWRARVYDISSGLSLLRTYTGEQAGDTAWDVALAIDGQMATIKTKEHDLALLNVPSSSTSASDLFWAGTHSLTGYPPPSGVTYPGTSSGMPGINDATALLYPVEGSPGHRWAAFLGDTGGTNQATMVFYDLVVANWGTTVPTQAFTVTDSHTGATVAPADLELGFDGSDVIARTSAPFDDSLQAGGPDWGRWGGTTPAQVDVTLGGRGVCTGRDSLRMSRNAAVSISRHPDPQTIQGWVHIVKCTYVTPFP